MGNRLNLHLSESTKNLGTRVTSNSYRKTVGITSDDNKNVLADSSAGFNIEEGSRKMGKTAMSFPKVND